MLENIETYSLRDVNYLFALWKLGVYSLGEMPTVTYSCRLSRPKTFDEVMEEVLEDRAEAWDKLANA